MDNNNKLKSYNERFIRWQQLTLGQLAFTNNLFIGLNLGFLGFIIAQYELTFSCNCWKFYILLIVLLSIGTSFLTGTFLVINRLKDFRKTTQLIFMRKQKFKIENKFEVSYELELVKSKILQLKTETKKLGKISWNLLNVQIWSFMTGIIFGIIYILVIGNTYS